MKVIIFDYGGVVGPAHAFTPFKSIFRQNKFENLKECYQGTLKKINFIELGLSANTELADRIESLKNISFLSNSDAHSQEVSSLGREFNRFLIEKPSFEEVLLALERNYLAEERTALAVFRSGVSLALVVPPIILMAFSLSIQMDFFMSFLFYTFIIGTLAFGSGMIVLSRINLSNIRRRKRKVRLSEQKIINDSKKAKKLLNDHMVFDDL